MISPFAHVMLTAVVLVALFWASLLFNNHIDNRHKKRDEKTGNVRSEPGLMYDGETAVWVMLGTTYTNVGAGILVMIWWQELQSIDAPWRGAVFVTALIFACYIASGIPMAVGDAVRSLNLRTGK